MDLPANNQSMMPLIHTFFHFHQYIITDLLPMYSYALLPHTFFLLAVKKGVLSVFLLVRSVNLQLTTDSKGGVEDLADTASDIMTPVRNIEQITDINDILFAECAAYIENTGAVGLRKHSVKEMTEEERDCLLPLPLKRYEVAEEHTVTVDNRQLFRFDNCLYSAPREYASKTVAIKAYPYRVEVYYRGHMVWECDRPAFKGSNRVYAEHYKFSLDKAPRARENAFPLKEGILPPALHEFRKLCVSGNKYTQLYELMVKMDEVGPEKLLKAVELANAAGKPTYTKVMDILLYAGCDAGGPGGEAYAADGPDADRRAPSDFDILLGGDGRRK